MNWFVKCLQNYVTFSGRARRKEFWMFILFYVIFSFACGICDLAIGREFGLQDIFNLAFFLPSISVFVRRMHDIDRSGWWFWLGLLPIVGWIILIVFECTEGTKGTNRFGPDPKAGEASA